MHDASLVHRAEPLHVRAHEVAFHDHGHGHVGRLRPERYVGRGKGFELGLGQHGHGAVGFDDGVFHFAGIEISSRPQSFQHIVDVHVQFFEHVGEQVAFFDDDDGFAVEQFAEAQAPGGEFCDDDVHHEQREYRDYAVDYRNGGIAHGNAREVARHQSYGEFERLQFA